MTRFMLCFYMLITSIFATNISLVDVPDHQRLQSSVNIEQVWQPPSYYQQHDDLVLVEVNQQVFIDYPFNHRIVDDLLNYQQKVLVVLYDQQFKTLTLKNDNDFVRFFIKPPAKRCLFLYRDQSFRFLTI